MEVRKGPLEGLGLLGVVKLDEKFWSGKRVLVTGNTGFKGAWLTLWLSTLGADTLGYALKPPTTPSLYEICKINEIIDTVIGDVRDFELLSSTVRMFKPQIVIHMAAQPLVRDSYKIPVETYAVNVMGTVHLLEALRNCSSVRAVVNVTTDKCYENKEWEWGYRENEQLGGYDPYSNSKACSELVTSAYRSSYFNPEKYSIHRVAIATARAGNVIGGGDWAADRLIPDCLRALLSEKQIVIRNPQAIRPWQHVLEPLRGYLILAQKLYEEGPNFAEGWNFGPDDKDAKSVEWIVCKMCEKWQGNASYLVEGKSNLHEANYLKLDCSKAKSRLGWYPKWTLNEALDRIIEWTTCYRDGRDSREVCLRQINEYSRL